MICWVVKFYSNSSGRRGTWHLNLRTTRRTRSAALQAPLDEGIIDLDSYNLKRQNGHVRAVKFRLERMP